MRNPILMGLALTAAIALAPTPAVHAGEGHAAHAAGGHAAFDQLKGLAGTWQGAPEYKGPEHPEEEEMKGAQAVHEIKLSANGTVVEETMNPGTEHEMINMYHLDGDDLVLTHYCAGGNQPTMRLDPEASTDSKLVFEFTGGTNLDPATDTHIHSAEITFNEDGTITSSWNGYNAGEPAGTMVFRLARQE